MSLKSINLDRFDTPRTAKKSEKTEDEAPIGRLAGQKAGQYHLVTIKQTSTGGDILLCTVDPAPQAALAEAERLGLPLFTTAEIPHIKKAAEQEPGFIAKIIDIKTTMPGTTVRRYREAS